RFCSEEFDKLHQEAIGVTDDAERAAIYHRMQDMMEESGAYRFLTHEGSPIMYRESAVEPAVRPDSRPLYRFFKA
ncbi:MAG: peptide ABC transporter substrate-binding protein, partial [Rhodovibrionaceae bacterium]